LIPAQTRLRPRLPNAQARPWNDAIELPQIITMQCGSEQTSFAGGLEELDYASSTEFGGKTVPCKLGTYELSPMQMRAAAALLNAYQRSSAPELYLTFPFGSGKTLISLAVAAQVLRGGVSRAGYEIPSGEAPASRPLHHTDRLFVRLPAKAVRNMVIIFARNATIPQWMRHLQGAGLRATRATTWLEFETKFKVELVAPGGAPWEVVVVRDGHISTLPDSKNEMITTVKAVELTMRAAGCAAQLVIYDDYDKGLHSSNDGVPACAALLVSGTAAGGPLKPRAGVHPSLRWIQPGALVARGAPAELDEDMQVPSLRVLAYVFSNPDDRYAAMLGDLAGEAVAEMLNGMACETAARALGIDTRSPQQMFRAVLQQRYTEWMNGQKAEKYLAAADAVLARAAALMADRDEELQYIAACRALMQRTIAVLAAETCEEAHVRRQFPFRHGAVTEIVARRSAEVRAKVAECNDAVERFRTRIGESECIICSETEFPEGFFVTKCCYSVLCGKCLAKGTHQQGKSAVGRCPSCRNALNYRDDVLFIASDVDIEQLMECQPEPEPEPAPAAPASAPDEWQKLPPKLMALNYIIRGMPVPADAPNCLSQTEMRLSVANVLGRGNAPTASGPPAVLVFASYDESLNIIAAAIESFCACAVLPPGSRAHAVIDRFNAGELQVLLVCSQRDCAGLDLQHATDIVFFNEFSRVSEFAQSVGRVQRFGRNEVAARCHILAFPNEQSLVHQVCAPEEGPPEFPLYAAAARSCSAAADASPPGVPPDAYRLFRAVTRRLKIAFPEMTKMSQLSKTAGKNPKFAASPLYKKLCFLMDKFSALRGQPISVDFRTSATDYNGTIKQPKKKREREAQQQAAVLAREERLQAAVDAHVAARAAPAAQAAHDPDFLAHQAALEAEPDEDVRAVLRASYQLFNAHRQ